MMSNEIFDKARIRSERNKHSKNLDHYRFLIDYTTDSICDRLSVITLSFEIAVIYGARLSKTALDKIIKALNAETVILLDLSEELLKQGDWPSHIYCVQSDSEWLPFAHKTIDTFIGVFEHHTLNDLPGALIQAQRALKPNGLFMVAMPGGDTLYEVREAMVQTEVSLYNGVAPRIYPFADKQQYGGLMQRAGFALPVVDSEHITVSYENLLKLFTDLKHMAEGNVLKARSQKPINKALLEQTEQRYRQDNNYANQERFDVTFEIIHMIGWAPDKTKQQQPLKPGSAEHSLVDLLSLD